jgi:uncharacterized membrane protein YdbT with pleckstrin-like domain
MQPDKQPNNPHVSASEPPRQAIPGLLLSEMDLLNHDENVVTIIHKSIIGLVYIYIEAFAAVVALLALAVLAFPDLFSSLSANSNALLMAAVVFSIVTDQNLIQILQGGLFSRKISRLSVSNVEDVTADQHGFLQTIFGYGTLTVETAGEMKNFIFPYCPNPNKYADQILDARQAYANRLEEKD